MAWGKRKDGQAYNKDRKKGISGAGQKTTPTSDVHLKEQEPRFKQIPVWKFDDAQEDLREKILEKHRDINVTDNFYADDEGLLDSNIFKWHVNKMYFDLDRGQYIQFTDLEVKDGEKFRKLLGISKPLWNKISFTFKNRNRGGVYGSSNTEIEFTQETSENYYELDDEGKGGKLSQKEEEQISDAVEIFRDIIRQGWVNLRNNYEGAMSDESVAETLRINEYDFDESGDIA